MELTGSTPNKQSESTQSTSTKSGGGGKDFFDSFSSLPAESSKANADEDTVEGSWVDRDDIDLIEKTVEDFRMQRLSMVQSLRQFVLCYESIMEWLVEQEQGPPDSGAE
jgi:protein-tyrosine phosphatase